ncbi:long-chain fatty acid transporter ACB1 [Penicillium longicatenatum]|nr:long-chain fatty acid transporter ACB1 [Penicillium longicatenatum]
MSALKDQFDQAAKDVNNLKQKPSNDELLKLYALYKQATVGDCNTERPSAFNLKEKYKWDAWNALKGETNEQAMEQYVKFVDELKASHGF